MEHIGTHLFFDVFPNKRLNYAEIQDRTHGTHLFLVYTIFFSLSPFAIYLFILKKLSINIFMCSMCSI